MGQGPWAGAHGPGPMGWGPWARANGPGPRCQGPWAKAHRPGPMGQGPWAKDHSQGPWAKAHGPGPIGQGPWAHMDQARGAMGQGPWAHMGQGPFFWLTFNVKRCATSVGSFWRQFRAEISHMSPKTAIFVFWWIFALSSFPPSPFPYCLMAKHGNGPRLWLGSLFSRFFSTCGQ